MAAASGAWTGAAWTVRAAVRAFRRAHPEVGDEVCVALSGGADSLALTAAAAAEFADVTALVVDHGLQPGSDEVARRAAAAARGLGVDAEVLVVVVDQRGSGPEAAARSARYTALEAARRDRPVLLAHTLDDQAETVLLGLGRGSGARSLRGMAAWDAPWGRPLLGVRAADTRAACRDLGLTWWDDPHNIDPAYTRVRVRHEVLPLLEDVLGGGVAEGLARTAELARVDDDELDRLAEAVPVGDDGALDVSRLERVPTAVLTRVLRRWLLSRGVTSPTYAHLTAVAALVTDWRGQGGVAVGGSGPAGARGVGPAARLVARRRHGRLVVENERASGAGT
ncbi:tRNA lysidine(34) synthetase TilS [Dietzia cinnamea]|uniref:tRNA lysidine(34) synthetase TilS n=1 Tax=Dietzia TaxID=37914 RepID=UPI000D09443A|nr:MULTISPECIES: tRNA lysidine(34) synthetase TilS [Dietzia]AVM64478.1 tRNA lysidine(34) synthetase TilS [Dietzia sp. oral taxon 368]MCT1712987.1 tRNA lysidine(34) synthetase TilS [Dietzia cinnamea]